MATPCGNITPWASRGWGGKELPEPEGPTDANLLNKVRTSRQERRSSTSCATFDRRTRPGTGARRTAGSFKPFSPSMWAMLESQYRRRNDSGSEDDCHPRAKTNRRIRLQDARNGSVSKARAHPSKPSFGEASLGATLPTTAQVGPNSHSLTCTPLDISLPPLPRQSVRSMAFEGASAARTASANSASFCLGGHASSCKEQHNTKFVWRCSLRGCACVPGCVLEHCGRVGGQPHRTSLL